MVSRGYPKQVITTKHLSATTRKLVRVSATSSGGARVIVSWPAGADHEEAHASAARSLCAKLDWHGSMVVGSTPDGFVYVFCGPGTPRIKV